MKTQGDIFHENPQPSMLKMQTKRGLTDPSNGVDRIWFKRSWHHQGKCKVQICITCMARVNIYHHIYRDLRHPAHPGALPKNKPGQLLVLLDLCPEQERRSSQGRRPKPKRWQMSCQHGRLMWSLSNKNHLNVVMWSYHPNVVAQRSFHPALDT